MSQDLSQARPSAVSMMEKYYKFKEIEKKWAMIRKQKQPEIKKIQESGILTKEYLPNMNELEMLAFLDHMKAPIGSVQCAVAYTGVYTYFMLRSLPKLARHFAKKYPDNKSRSLMKVVKYGSLLGVGVFGGYMAGILPLVYYYDWAGFINLRAKVKGMIIDNYLKNDDMIQQDMLFSNMDYFEVPMHIQEQVKRHFEERRKSLDKTDFFIMSLVDNENIARSSQSMTNVIILDQQQAQLGDTGELQTSLDGTNIYNKNDAVKAANGGIWVLKEGRKVILDDESQDND